MTILFGAFGHFRAGSTFYQFTYGPRCLVTQRTLERLGLKASMVGKTLPTALPASVYRITRRRPVLSLTQ